VKVTLVTTLERGGPVEHARLLARELVAAGAVVRAIATSEAVAEALAAAGAEPVVVRSQARLDPRAVARVRGAGRDVDVVHSHDRRSALWTLAAPRPSGGAARVHTLHGLPDAYLPIPGRPRRAGLRDHVAHRIVEGRLVGRAEALAVPSQATLDRATALGYRTARAVVVPNGVEVGGALPRPLGTAVGMLAALEPVKGVDVFLRAAALLHPRDPSLRFVVFGSGSQLGALEDQARRSGLADVVRFAGPVPTALALAQLRVVVVSSHYESTPLVGLEAMAAGIPLVATRVGGVPEMAPPDALVLVPPDDAAALADAIGATLLDTEAAEARAQRARRHVVAERSAAATARATEAVYRVALDRRGR